MKKRRKLKKRAIYIFLSVISIILLIVTIAATFNTKGNKKVIGSITYNKRASMDASICLRDNEFIKGSCYNDEKSYVTAMIDHINLDLKLDVQASNIVDYGYNYDVTVRVIANEKGDESKIVYDKTDIIASGEFNNITSNALNFYKTINLDYNQYNSIINEFKKKYVLALDSHMIVSFNAKGQADYKDIKDEMSVKINLSLIIPLAEQTITVDKSNSTIHKEDTNVKLSTTGSYNIVAFVTDIIYKVDIAFFIIAIIVFIKLGFNQTNYDKKLKKILREYDRAITIAKTMPDLSGLKIIEVDSFSELLDVKENIAAPIICYKNSIEDETIFVILDYKLAYIYVFTADELKEKKG